MKVRIISIALSVFILAFLSACAGGREGRGGRVVYQHHYGYGGWWGYPGYIDRRPIIVPPEPGVPPGPGDGGAVNLPVYPDTGAPGFEAMPQIEPPMMEMDMGMPELMDMGM